MIPTSASREEAQALLDALHAKRRRAERLLERPDVREILKEDFPGEETWLCNILEAGRRAHLRDAAGRTLRKEHAEDTDR